MSFNFDETIGSLFLATVRTNTTSTKCALQLDDTSITYAQLSYHVQRLANRLIYQYGLQVGDVVCQCMERSMEMIVGILGIMLAGGAYCPLDPTDPSERLNALIKDTKAKIVLVHPSTEKIFQNIDIMKTLTLNLDDDEHQQNGQNDMSVVYPAKSSNIAYIIFTSGSTGKPKGVPITHANFINHWRGLTQRLIDGDPLLKQDDTILATAMATFDISLTEMLCPLLTGARLIMLHAFGDFDTSYILNTLASQKVTLMFAVPSLLRILMQHCNEQCDYSSVYLTTLHKIWCGGEALTIQLASQIYNTVSNLSELVNLYGPTECTIAATYHRVTREGIARQIIPIGRPLPNYTCHILNDHLTPVPIGTLGELYIGGHGVFAGYLTSDESINARALIQLSHLKIDGTKCYRTGDLCRIDEHGEIIFGGRVDYQVKLRGQRLEVGEIEACIMRTKNITNCIVIKCNDSRSQQDFLAAYVETTLCSKDEVRQQCRNHLPAYMVPSVFVILHQLPLNSNGKIERKQLTVVDLSQEQTPSPRIAARNETEARVHRIWCLLFNRPQMSVLNDFFAMGGDSLLCIKLLYELQKEFGCYQLTVKDLLEATTIETQAKMLQTEEFHKTQSAVLVKSGMTEAIASHSQQQLYREEESRTQDDMSVYGISIGTRILSGELDEDRLREALYRLVERHEVLRTTYNIDPTTGLIHQYVQPFSPSSIEWRCSLSDDEIKTKINEHFNLHNGPLVRCNLSRTKDFFIVTIHQMAFDAASVPVFCRELTTLYNDQEALLPLPLQYIDYTLQIDSQMSSDDDRLYWTQTLAGSITNELSLPFDRLRHGERRTCTASFVHCDIPASLLSKMKEHREYLHLTMFMQMLSTYQLFLARLTQTTDICIGSVNTNRPRVELNSLIGFFVNTLPYRMNIDGNICFNEMCTQTKQLCLDVLKHASYPFDKIVQLHRNTTATSSPFFQTKMQYENIDKFRVYVDMKPALSTCVYELEQSTTTVDLQLLLQHQCQTDEDEKLRITFIFVRDRFDLTTIQTMMDRFALLLHTLFTSSPSDAMLTRRHIGSLYFLLDHEQRLIANMNNTSKIFPSLTTIHEAIVHTASTIFDDRPAIILDDQQLTYPQLLKRSQCLADYLRSTCHVIPGDIIGQCVERSIDMAVGMLAILLAGGVYCPLNPSDPLERLLGLVNDTGTRVILIHSSTESKFNTRPQDDLILIDINMMCNSQQLPPLHIEPHSVAYLIHTSGSTGKPKSVQLTHKNFLNALYGYDAVSMYCMRNERVLQMAACSFDIHVMECLGPLVNGSTCVMLKPQGNLDLAYVVSTIHRHCVNVSFFVPSFLYTLYAHLELTDSFHLLASMRQIVFGGEAAQPARLAQIFSIFSQRLNIELVNGYGPAETTVFAVYHILTQADIDRGIIPIGRPLPNYTCHILNDHLTPVPIGTLGELYIGGHGVFAGYLTSDESINARALIQLPYQKIDGTKCYRTGDLCRMDEQGEIIFGGRVDYQVKLRGQRLEVGEIEACIMRTKNVTNCIVIKCHDSRSQQDFLTAYVESTSCSKDDVCQQCRNHLPAYMVPSVFVILDRLPLNPNGKVDRKQLPVVDLSQEQTSSPLIAARNETEARVHRIWCLLFNRPQMSVLNDFFATGGDSLLCMKLLSELQKEFGFYQLTVKDLLEATTIETQAKMLDSEEFSKIQGTSLLKSGTTEGVASHAQQRLYLDDEFRVHDDMSVYGISIGTRILSGELDEDRLRQALYRLVERHEVLRTTYNVDATTGLIYQYVQPFSPSSIEWRCSLSDDEIKTKINEHFNLHNGPLVRCNLSRTKDFFIVTIHHIAFDGASVPVFCRELATLYNDQEALLPLPLQYIDYTLQIDSQMTSDDDRQYWTETLAGSIANELSLPFDRLRHGERRTCTASFVHCNIPASLLAKMKEHREYLHLTMFMQMLSIYQLFLARLTQTTDICIGSVNTNRPRVELNSLIGFFVNTLPYRMHIDGNICFNEMCTKTKQLCLDVLKHASYPFDKIVQLHRNNTATSSPFFQTMMRYENVDEFRMYADMKPALSTCEYELEPSTTMVDLQLLLRHECRTDDDEKLRITFIFSRDRFELATVQTMMNRFELLLHTLFTSSPSDAMLTRGHIGSLYFLLDHEQRLIADMNNTSKIFPSLTTIHEAIVHTASTIFDDRPAIILDDQQLTYPQLLKRSQCLADYLRSTCHVIPGDIIGQCVERSIDMAVGMLAILLAGGVYCPLNPSDPLERLLGLVNDTGTRVILIHSSTESKFNTRPQDDLILIDINMMCNSQQLPPLHIEPHSVAYLIHTSGSTGKPKSVQLTHKNFLNALYGYDAVSMYCMRNERVLQMAACSFDIHVMECLGPLVNGSTCVMLKPQGNLDLAYVVSTIHRHCVNVAFLVPSFLYTLYEHLKLTDSFHLLAFMRQIVFGGEAAQPARLAQIFSVLSQRLNIELVNGYGPAETTVYAVYHILTQADIDREIIPIGRPLPNYTCHILNDHLTPVPIGTLGELYIGGHGVFAGYLTSDESINARALIQLSHLKIDGTKCYRTGDLCRMDAQGEIIFGGRVDYQVKLRGQRLEVGEIEACIMRTKNVTNCIVIKCHDSRSQQDFLAAYVETTLCSKDEVRQQCRNHLPAYMVPSVFVILDRLPLNPNGKVDRKQLPAAELNQESDVNDEFQEPRTELEREVHNHWCTILNVERVSMNANFFAIGGNSLLLSRLFAAYSASGFVPPNGVTVASLFDNTTVEEHVRLLRLPDRAKILSAAMSKVDPNHCNNDVENSAITWVPLGINEAPASTAQQRIWLDEQLHLGQPNSPAIYNVPLPIVVEQCNEFHPVSVMRLRRALLAVIRINKVLRTRLRQYSEEDDVETTLKQSVKAFPNQINLEDFRQHETFYSFAESVCESENELNDTLSKEVRDHLFRLEQGLVVRCHIIRRKADNLGHEYLISGDIIVFNVHHIAFDGASRAPFFRDLQRAFHDEETFKREAEGRLQYIDYSIYSLRENISRSHAYWQETFNPSVVIEPLALPFDHPELANRPRTGQGDSIQFSLSEEDRVAMIKFCTEKRMSMFMLGMTLWQLYLALLTQLPSSNSICIGSVSDDRTRILQGDNLIGMFVNTVPYCVKFDRSKTFTEFARQIRDLCITVLEHSHVPYQTIVDYYRHINKQSSTLVQSTFSYQNQRNNDVNNKFILEQTTFESVPLLATVAKFDLVLYMHHTIASTTDKRSDESINFSLDYATDLFKHKTAQIIVDRFLMLIALLFRSPTSTLDECQLSSISLLLPWEAKLLTQMNTLSDCLSKHDTNENIGSLFLANVRTNTTSSKCALQLDDTSITYEQLSYHVQRLANRLIHQYGLQVGDVVCQCMERSMEMIVGILGIMLAGGTYCPLNPVDPSERLNALIKDTKAKIVLVHSSTEKIFQNIDLVKTLTLNLNDGEHQQNGQNDMSVICPAKSSNIAYIIFTSGSTGKPKGVPITHANFINHWRGLTQRLIDGDPLLKQDDTILATAMATFDISLTEMLCPLLTGARLIMLHAFGHLDASYILNTLASQRVTLMFAVPSLLRTLMEYCDEQCDYSSVYLTTLHKIWCGGEALTIQLASQIYNTVSNLSELVNLYGPTECTIAATYHRVTREDIAREIIPIGRPLPNYTCHILNDHLTPVPIGTLGELYIGGHGVFAGYLTSDESINARALIQLSHLKIDGTKCYRSGDLCRLNEQGEIICVGRADYQVKLRGQRLEVGEIEACIMRTKNVTNCIVIKCNDSRSQQDFLAAYVETTLCSKDEVRQQCRNHLPAYMVPSVFVILDRLPLNPNGKVDRKQLAPAELNQESDVNDECQEPRTELEREVHNHWCTILNVERVSMNANFFASGGNSLLLMKLLSAYRTSGLVPPGEINTASFFEHATLVDHARQLQPALSCSPKNNCLDNDMVHQSTEWIPLKLNEARASAAQERIWLDEQLRFFGPKSQAAVYNVPLPIVVGESNQQLTVSRLRQALLSVMCRHKVLRTRLQHRVESTGGVVKQYVNMIPHNVQHATIYSFVESVCESDNELKQALTNEVNGQFFHVDKGQVVRCHVIRRNPTELGQKHLTSGDVIVFNFHHVAFDGASRIPFFRDLECALENVPKKVCDDDHSFQYIDYSIYEWRLLLDDSNSSIMSEARAFWKEFLTECIDNQISLLESQEPKEETDEKGNQCGNFLFNIEKRVVDNFISLSASENMSLFQMSLAAYILFLYKMTYDRDICVGCVSANRYRSELEDLVGMFVNILPYRVKFGSVTETLNNTSSIRFYIKEIRRICVEVMRHGRLPFQDIVKLHRKPQEQSSRSPFFQTTFDFDTVITSDSTVCTLDGIPCKALDLPVNVAKYDLSFVVKHSISNDGEHNLVCSWEYATKVFDSTTIQRLSERFVVFLTSFIDEQTIDQTSVILPYELAIHRQLNDTHIDFKNKVMCIATNFHMHAVQEPQKTCLILDEKRLTYAEVNEQANYLAQHLLSNCGVRQGDVIMQCVQRSLEMVIGILAILKAQAVYCPLNPADPSERHALLVEDTKARVILGHTQTQTTLLQWTSNKKNLLVVDMSDLLSSEDSRKSGNVKLEPNAAENCAYIIYTSGSTGKPKAVSIRHCNFMACILGFQHMKIYQSTDIIAQMTACSYDVHVMELLGCLVTGGTLVMLKPFGNMDMKYVAQTIYEQRITWSILVPTIALSLYEYLNAHPEHAQRLQSLRICVSGGEAMVPSTTAKLLPFFASDIKIYNAYGPAECSMTSTVHLVTKKDLNATAVPIGRPLPNYTCHILDEYLAPVPIGCLGELYIGGPGVFAGYLTNDESINARALVSLPYQDDTNKKFYRTGDLCRLNDEGEIVYVGRTDYQVKLRGQRLELGEIEACILRAVPTQATNCAVIKCKDDRSHDEFLAAYIQAARGTSSDEYNVIQVSIMKYCIQHLPAFMVPAAWLVLETLPLNSNDKVDRKRLPPIDRTALPPQIYIEPPTPKCILTTDTLTTSLSPPGSLRETLSEIFSCALNIPISENQWHMSFGELGGTSLSAMTVVTLIRERLYPAMEIGLLFQHSSVQALSSILVQTQNPSICSPAPSLRSEAHTPSIGSVSASAIIQIEPELPKDVSELDWNENHVKPSIIIETIGILLLVYHYLYPAWISIKIIEQIPLHMPSRDRLTYANALLAAFVEVLLLFLLVPTIQLASYIVCKWFLLGRSEPGTYRLFTIRYYYYWFVHRIWLLNAVPLNAIIGTPIYNIYLRLCGARIGHNVHINTTLIDNPDLLTIDDHTYIAASVTLATMSYERHDYRLDPIRIGSNCSIQTRVTLQHGVHIKNNVLVKSMSFVSGNIATNSIVDGIVVTSDARQPVDYLFGTLRLSWLQMIYQFICIQFVFLLQIIISIIIFATYLHLFPKASQLYIFIVLPLIWLLTTFSNVIIAIVTLLLLVGRVSPGVHPVNSWYFLHKMWFRQLIVNTFCGSFFIFGGYHVMYPKFLRWFGAKIGDDVKIGDIVSLLTGPSNLIQAGDGLTTNGKCLIAPIDVIDGQCSMQKVHIGNYVTLGNAITVHCGAHIPEKCMIGTATRIEPDKVYDENKIVLGVPARVLPFGLPALPAIVSVEQTPSSCQSHFWYSLVENVLEIIFATALAKLVIAISGICLIFFVFIKPPSTLTTLTNIFLILPYLYIIFMILLSCSLSVLYRLCNRDVWNAGTYGYKTVVSWRRHLSWCLLVDFQSCAGPFLGGTQWLVYLMRGLGAHIGRNVLLYDLFNLVDPQQLTIEDNVRISGTSSVQCHTFEQRLFKLAPTLIGSNSVLDHTAMVLSGCHLEGNNHIHPCTLIMKGDRLPAGTNWYGCPAQAAAIHKMRVERDEKHISPYNV